jgi:hypothetical protein
VTCLRRRLVLKRLAGYNRSLHAIVGLAFEPNGITICAVSQAESLTYRVRLESLTYAEAVS